MSELYPKAPPEAIDLLRQMLLFNPQSRVTAAQAMRHAYLSEFFDETDLNCDTSVAIDEKFDVGDNIDWETKVIMIICILLFTCLDSGGARKISWVVLIYICCLFHLGRRFSVLRIFLCSNNLFSLQPS